MRVRYKPSAVDDAVETVNKALATGKEVEALVVTKAEMHALMGCPTAPKDDETRVCFVDGELYVMGVRVLVEEHAQ